MCLYDFIEPYFCIKYNGFGFAVCLTWLPSVLLNLSPLELSKHAVELEKRAIQLTIDEGKDNVNFLAVLFFPCLHQLVSVLRLVFDCLNCLKVTYGVMKWEHGKLN